MWWLRRFRSLLLWLRGSLWIVPAIMTIAAVVLAFFTISIEMRVPARVRAEWWFVFGVGPDGVRGVLSALAGSIITVAGVVFSITVVALQLASTQYSPRVLRTFLEDRSTHVVLGVFLATFVYAMLVLRTVRAETPGAPEFVPSLSVTVAMALGLLSMASLIFFIHDIAQSIRASVIVKRLTVDARAIAGRAFPREFGAPLPDSVDAADDQPREGERWIVAADAPGYLATMDEDILFGHDSGEAFTVRMAVCIGEFVRTGDAIAEICAAAAPDRRRIEGAVRGAFRLAAEPSGPQDIGVAVSRLTDVAVRALSPSSNDAATAAACVDGLSEVFVALGRRLPPDAVRASPDGRVRLVAKHPSFEELLDVTFAPLRHHGAGDPMIAMKLLDVALALGERVHESRRALFVREAELVLRAASQAIANEDQRARVRGRAEVVLTRLGGQIRS